MSKELWISHHSAARWLDAGQWNHYLRSLEEVLGDRLVKLDTNDPIKRKADTLKSEGDFVVAFKPKEDSRWLFGSFERTSVQLEIRHFKTLGSWENSVTVKFPEGMASIEDVSRVRGVFDLGNQLMRPFYSMADLKEVVCSRNPSTPSLDISRELLGVFWLTHFGPAYRRFFGAKLDGIPGLELDPEGGATLQLGDSPAQVDNATRDEIMERLGPASFANGGPPKERGRFALTLNQLADSERQAPGG
jgi:hypothetical protein